MPSRIRHGKECTRRTRKQGKKMHRCRSCGGPFRILPTSLCSPMNYTEVYRTLVNTHAKSSRERAHAVVNAPLHRCGEFANTPTSAQRTGHKSPTCLPAPRCRISLHYQRKKGRASRNTVVCQVRLLATSCPSVLAIPPKLQGGISFISHTCTPPCKVFVASLSYPNKNTKFKAAQRV